MANIERASRTSCNTRGMALSVGVQIVLFENGLGEVWRLVRGLSASIRRAREVGVVGEVEVVIGDSSSRPRLAGQSGTDLLGWFEDATGIEATYTFFDENLMTARGHNTLAESHGAEIIWVINPDTYPQPEALVELLDAMTDPAVGAAEARQIPLEHPKSFHSNGDTSWASGFCVLYRRSTFDQVGGYDAEHFPLYCDDVDISWRMRLAGFRVVHVPSAGVFHDKRLGREVHVLASEVEEYYGAFSRLMLTRRYGRPDIETETLEQIEAHGSTAQRRAVADFERRDEAGEVPAPMPDAGRVAEFVAGEYAARRF